MPATTKDKTWDRYVPEPLSRTMSLAMGSTPQPSRGSQTPNTTRPPPSYFTTSMGNPAAPIYPEPLAKVDLHSVCWSNDNKFKQGDVIWMERSHLRLLLGFLVRQRKPFSIQVQLFENYTHSGGPGSFVCNSIRDHRGSRSITSTLRLCQHV